MRKKKNLMSDQTGLLLLARENKKTQRNSLTLDLIITLYFTIANNSVMQIVFLPRLYVYSHFEVLLATWREKKKCVLLHDIKTSLIKRPINHIAEIT